MFNHYCPKCKTLITNFTSMYSEETGKIIGTLGWCPSCDTTWPISSLYAEQDTRLEDWLKRTLQDPPTCRQLTIQHLNALIDKGVLSDSVINTLKDAVNLLTKDGESNG